MTELPMDELVVAWTGFPGAPGYSVFHAIPEGGVQAHIVSLFNAFKNNMPSNVKMTIPGSGRTLDATTGNQIGVWSGATTTVVQGADTGKYSAPTGMVINWSTSTLHKGRMIRGRTFFVPMGGVTFDTDGSIVDSYLNTWNGNVADFVADCDEQFVIWARPSGPSASDGFRGHVTSGRIPDKAAILSSRRP